MSARTAASTFPEVTAAWIAAGGVVLTVIATVIVQILVLQPQIVILRADGRPGR
jgi:hypothetical protein